MKLLQELIERAGLSRSDPETEINTDLPSKERVDALEASIGHPLPPDVRWLFEHHSGTRLSEPGVRRPRRQSSSQGSIVTLRGTLSIWGISGFGNGRGSDVEQRCGLDLDFAYFDDTPEMPLLRPVNELIDDLVYRLVPITPAMFRTCLCLDFRHDPENPPIIDVNYEDIGGPDEHGLRRTNWATYIAPSLTELLKVAHRDEHYLASLPEEPYEFAEELIQWDQSFDTYMSQWSPIAPGHSG